MPKKDITRMEACQLDRVLALAKEVALLYTQSQLSAEELAHVHRLVSSLMAAPAAANPRMFSVIKAEDVT